MSKSNLDSQANHAMRDYWNGRAGEKWTRMQNALDRMLTPVTELLQTQLGDLAGQRLLDIGCGTGETCLLWLKAGADVTGVDISAPMLELARERTAGRARLIEADASRWRDETPFDLAVSRFGVMFFDQPGAAFANLRANLRPGGRLVFACWRAPADNAWASTASEAIRDLLPPAPPPDPHAPGPFALADGERLQMLLSEAGFTGIRLAAHQVNVCLADRGGLDQAVEFALQIGPAGAALAEADDALKKLAADRLRQALAPYVQGTQVLMPAGIWLVEADNPS